MICFKCGRQGHKEDACGIDATVSHVEAQNIPEVRQSTVRATDIHAHTYGSWMLVKNLFEETMAETKRQDREPEDVSRGSSARTGLGGR